MAGKKQAFVADPAIGKANLREALDKLRAGLGGLATPEGITDYLDFVSRPSNIGRYSLNNQMLIKVQCPHATEVGNYWYWVKRRRMPIAGQGIKILGPTQYTQKVKLKEEELDLHPDAERDENGDAYIERMRKRWKTITLWDISQTTDRSKRPYVPPIAAPRAIPGHYTDEQDELAAQVDTRIRAWVASQQVEIINEATQGTWGSYSPMTRTLRICPLRPPVPVCGTALHEAAHLCEFDLGTRSTYNLGEFVAEGTAYVIMQRYGLDISGFSFAYVRGYGANQKMFQRGVDAIRKIAQVLVEAIEGTGAQLDAPVEDAQPMAAD